MADFVPGLELARRFYTEAVRPRLAVPHSAALIGPGSEVLGFDTARSTDHDWGPRVLVFVEPGVVEPGVAAAPEVPAGFAGWPTLGVTVTDLATWFGGALGFDPRAGVTILDWLATPTQRLAEVTGGAVFHDGLGSLTPARRRLAWYPEDVWRYVMACQWTRIAEEEPFVGRCAEVGDPAGAAVVAARLARDLLRLSLLQHRRYPPYSKWLGSAARDLPVYEPVLAALRTDGPTRERHLCRAYGVVAATHNALALTGPLDPQPRFFYDRPFLVLDAGRFAAALLAGSPLARLPRSGAFDQFADSTPLSGDMAACRAAVRAVLADPVLADPVLADPVR
jgi:Domain of unknown function (DUF4037)